MSSHKENNVSIGTGNLAGKGLYAARDFSMGEVVVAYHLTPLREEQFDCLSESEKMFTHVQHGTIYLYGEPERYMNHSDSPNTLPDHTLHADVAIRPIKKNEMVTTDSRKDDIE